MTMNAASLLLAGHDPRRKAFVCGDVSMRYDELAHAVACAGSAWRELGLARGDRVAIKLPDSIEWAVAYLGVIWAGGVAVGVNPRIPAPDWQYVLNEGAFRHVLALDRDEAPAPFCDDVVALDAWLEHLAAAGPMPAEAMAPEEPCFWCHSSGSSGQPKAVMHAHRFATQVERVAADLLGVTAADRLFASSKLFFAYPLGNSFFAGLKLGATVILDPRWPTPASVAQTIAEHRPTVLFSVPSLYRNLLKSGVAPGLASNGLRVCVSAGEALPSGLRNEWQRQTGIVIQNGFGASEVLSLVLFNAGDGELLSPTPGVDARPLNAASEGAPTRIRIAGPMVALGYWKRPDAQAESFRDGAFVPGDLFERSDDGRWRFAGREDSLVKIHGRWVDLVALEERLGAASAAIAEAAAVSVPDADGVAAVAFFYATKPELEASVQRDVEAVATTLPQYQRPRWVMPITALPRTATGKLLRRKLVALHAAQNATETPLTPAAS